MNRNAILAALGPHMKRPIRAFLADPKLDAETEEAFWRAIYPDGGPVVDYMEAMKVAARLLMSREKVERVLEGAPMIDSGQNNGRHPRTVFQCRFCNAQIYAIVSYGEHVIRQHEGRCELATPEERSIWKRTKRWPRRDGATEGTRKC